MANEAQHEGIGTIKMRSRRFEATTPLAPSASAVEDKSAFALLHSATAAILSPMAGGQRMSPVPGHEQDDDDDEDEEVLADDGLSSSSDDDYEDALGTSDPGESHEMAIVETLAETIYDKSAGLPQHNLPPEMDDRILKSSGLLTPSRKPAQTPSRQSSMPGYFDRPTHQEYGESPALSVPGTPGDTKRRPRFKRNKSATPSKKSTKDFNFDANQGRDVLGIVMVEIKSAADLPKIKNCELASHFPCLAYGDSSESVVRHGSVRRRVLRKEGVSDEGDPALAQPHLGRAIDFPREAA
jgi:phosphatidylserine decarboxylase